VSARVGLAFEHVAFDLDGTLIDSRADLAGSVNHVMRELALPEVEPVTLYGYVGHGARVLVQRALGPVHQEHLEAGVALFMAYYAEHLLDATRPYPGIVAALEALGARGAVLSVLTNKPAALSVAILDGLGLRSRFVEVIGGDSLPVRKPDPRGLDHLRMRTGTARERTLLVGDSPIDVQTARAAGTGFCGVAWGIGPDALRAADPERLIASPAELVPVVERG
jgi:phosphoglycolate phosphatase